MRKAKLYIDHKSLGRVWLTLNSQAKRYVARVRAGEVHLTCPVNTTPAEVIKTLDAMAPTLLPRIAESSQRQFHIGDVLQFDGMTIIISRQSFLPDKVNLYSDGKSDLCHLRVGTNLDVESIDIQKLIHNGLRQIAKLEAPGALIPLVRELASKHGLSIGKVSIGRGEQRLGSCNRQGDISISSIVMFLPDVLRRYVINHELTHLTHFDHSPEFYDLLDRYSDGHERELRRKLREYKWPFERK